MRTFTLLALALGLALGLARFGRFLGHSESF